MDKATPDSAPANVEGVMAIAFELARIREQHGAQSGMYLSEVRALRAEAERLAAQSAPSEEMSPEFTDTARAALLWVLWHHQGASSKVGQPIRFALGMDQYQRLSEYQVREAKRWEALGPTRDAANVPPGEWKNEGEGLTPKQAWWAGYRVGKGLPPDMPRSEAVAQSAPTGLTDMGWVIDAATKGELAAYDQGIAESIQAVTKILDGKDAGAGIANRPWEPLRRRLLALVAQSAPTEIHADTPRHELLPRLRRLASDFQSHPLSRSISECEEAGIAMAEAAKQIEMLCRTRDTVVNHSGRMRKEIAALTEHRDFLLREMAKIDGDPGNACHYAIEAISAVCAYVDADRAAAHVEPSAPPAPGGDVLRKAAEKVLREWNETELTYEDAYHFVKHGPWEELEAALQSTQGQTPSKPFIATAPSRVGWVYLAGPMTGIEDYNFPAFNAAAARLRAEGLNVVNPADHGAQDGVEWADYLRVDLTKIAACESIALLSGWSKSKGARLEVHVAQALGMAVRLLDGAESPTAITRWRR